MAFAPARAKNSSRGCTSQVRTLSVSRKYGPDPKISRIMFVTLVAGTQTSLPVSVAVTAAWASLGVRRFDVEARLLLARFGKLLVANVYFPKGSGPNRDNSRIPFKLAFYRRLFKLLAPKKDRGERVIVLGDFNTAHHEIDLARPKQNVMNSGFRPEERRELDRWLKSGWVDTFRHVDPRAGKYTWWSNRSGARDRNVGWRIDYVLASPAAMPFLRRAFISNQVTGSDHCPVGVDVDDEIAW